MPYTEEQLGAALKNAHAAGDVAAAQKFAKAIQEMRANASSVDFDPVAPKADKEMSWGEIGEDAVRSTLHGLRAGTEQLVGLPGDLREIAASAGGYFGGEGVKSAINDAPVLNMLPTYQDINQVTDKLVGEDYKPKSTAGEYLNTIASFAPAAAAGPGSALRKLGMTVLPGTFSETAGQLTEGSELEPYARVAGAIAGGVTAAGRPMKEVREIANAKAPTGEAMSSIVSGKYRALREAGASYNNKELSSTLRSLKKELDTSGLPDFRRGSEVNKLLDKLDEFAAPSPQALHKGANGKYAWVDTQSRNIDWSDVDALKQKATDIAIDAGTRLKKGEKGAGAEMTAANKVVDAINKFERSDSAFLNTSNMPKAEFDALRVSAREEALRAMKGRKIEELIRKAEFHNGGLNWGLRAEFGKFLKDPKSFELFKNKAEREMLMRIAKGTKGRNLLDLVGQAGVDLDNIGSIRNIIAPALAGGGLLSGGAGIVGAAATVGAATGAKKLAGRMITKDAELAKNFARMSRKEINDALRKGKKGVTEIQTRRALSTVPGMRPLEVTVYPGQSNQ
jgi:hypothetical protein